MEVVYTGHPLMVPTANEFAIISLADVTNEWQGMKTFTQSHIFTIIGQFRRPADYSTNILSTKITKANLLVDLLEPTAAHYASATDHYFVQKILLHEDLDDIDENIYKVGVEFFCTCTAELGG